MKHSFEILNMVGFSKLRKLEKLTPGLEEKRRDNFLKVRAKVYGEEGAKFKASQ